MLEPVIQGITTNDIVHATFVNNIYYLNMQDMADTLRFQFNPTTNTGVFLEKPFSITPQDLNKSEFLHKSNQDFYSVAFYERLLPIKLKIDLKEALLDISSDKTLPTTLMTRNNIARKSINNRKTDDAFYTYEFDNRWFTFPVMDLIYKHDLTLNNIHRENYTHTNSNYYQANLAMVFAGMDTQLTMFGNDYGSNKLTDVGARILGSKTWLDERHKPLNMARLQIGDIAGDTSNLFYYGSAGRGISASSFKDLITAADKTIDITGTMPIGWEAELYQNNQLIGFRQSSLTGQYQFLNVPVNFGLNDFKVILYGPYGEVRTVNQRYYSGVNPVRANEFGYNIVAQQPNRFLVETDSNWHNTSEKIAANSMLYYGLTDRLSLMAGLNNAPNPTALDSDNQFGALGTILALDGLAIQYNTTYNINNNTIGQHVDVQGDIYIGNLFSRYEYYGDTHSPISYYQGEYLRHLFESRLSGTLVSVPYYVSYTLRDGYVRHQNLQMRLSPNFKQYYNVTIENDLSYSGDNTENYITLLGQTTLGRFRANGQIKYRTNPSNALVSYGAFVEYRWDKNTYVQTTWNHDCRSHYADGPDTDTAGISIGRLFRFGGITLDAKADTDKNLTFGLTYNISIGKQPDRYKLFTNSENEMMNYGTVFVHAHDESNQPVENLAVQISGREAPIKTDVDGNAVITNIDAHQKVLINVDEQDTNDIALNPEWNTKKLILRPGVVRPIDIRLNHLGGFEGRISNMTPGEKYSIYVRAPDDKIIAIKSIYNDGTFLFDGIMYGTYQLSVYDSTGKNVGNRTITIDKNFQTLDDIIHIK